MLGSSKRRVFQPTAYGPSRRRHRRFPRWLMLMLTGIVLGAGGLLFLQTSYGPQRLTVEQSEQLNFDLNSANLEKQRLQSQLNQQSHQLKETQAKLEEQANQLQRMQASVAPLQEDIRRFAQAMPPDPRGTSPGIRAASFRHADGNLQYQLLIMQDDPKAKPFEGQAEFVVAGRYPNGRTANIELEGFPLSVDYYAHLDGSLELPASFIPRQVTIKVLQGDTRRQVATRILNVSR